MWQEVVVFIIVLLAVGALLYRFVQRVRGGQSGCGGGCGCEASKLSETLKGQKR